MLYAHMMPPTSSRPSPALGRAPIDCRRSAKGLGGLAGLEKRAAKPEVWPGKTRRDCHHAAGLYFHVWARQFERPAARCTPCGCSALPRPPHGGGGVLLLWEESAQKFCSTAIPARAVGWTTGTYFSETITLILPPRPTMVSRPTIVPSQNKKGHNNDTWHFIKSVLVGDASLKPGETSATWLRLSHAFHGVAFGPFPYGMRQDNTPPGPIQKPDYYVRATSVFPKPIGMHLGSCRRHLSNGALLGLALSLLWST